MSRRVRYCTPILPEYAWTRSSVAEDDGFQQLEADAGEDGTRGRAVSSHPRAHVNVHASEDGTLHAAEAPSGGSLFGRLFNPDKRKVAFQDDAAAPEEDDEDAGDDAPASTGGDDPVIGADPEDEEDVQKAWFLRQMHKLQAVHAHSWGGVGLRCRPMTMRHPLRDIKAEFTRMCADIDEEEGESTMKQVLSSIVNGAEVGNMLVGSPMRLNGWGGYFDDEIKGGKHDRVIAQLQAKYRRYTQLGPELRLVQALAVSAYNFHKAQGRASSVSGMMQDPEYVRAAIELQEQRRDGQHGAERDVPQQPARQQPMSRPEAAFTFSNGAIRPNVNIRTRPFATVQEEPFEPPQPLRRPALAASEPEPEVEDASEPGDEPSLAQSLARDSDDSAHTSSGKRRGRSQKKGKAPPLQL